MELIKWFVDFVLHMDDHLEALLLMYGVWTYIILFVIVFCETGLVVTPFLPGDSLLFAAGALAAIATGTSFNLVILLLVLVIAAIAGDTVNYWIGAWVGPQAFTRKLPLLKQSHLERTREFYAHHGGKTIVLARFVPIIRTFAPFVAGVGTMNYAHFLIYNVVGGIAWVVVFTVGGYLFGNIEIVRENFFLVTIGIIIVSLLPVLMHALPLRRQGTGDVAQS